MDVFNRFLIITLAVVSGLVAAIVLLVAVGAVSPDFVGAWFQDQLVRVDQLSGSGLTIAILAAIAVLLVSAMLIAMELSPLWTHEKIVLADTEGREFEMNAKSMERIIEHSGTSVAGVRRVKPDVSNGRDGLAVSLDAELQPTANASEAGAELRERIANAVETMTGKQVTDMKMNLRVAQPGHGRRVT